MIRRAWLAAVLALLPACDGPGSGGEPNAAEGPRIVSLAPHLTELVYSAGAGDQLVGVVSYSDYPPEARGKPRVGDAFRIDLERLAALAPTLVLAWEGGNPSAVIETLVDAGYHVEVFATTGLESIADNLRRIGRLADSHKVADRAADEFDRRLAALRTRYATRSSVSVFFQIGEQPLFTISDRHAIGQVLRLCGGRNVFADLPAVAASVSEESVVASNPQVLMTTGSVASLARWQRYEGRAVRAGHLFAVDADTITRDSLRLLDGAQQVCAQLDAVREADARP